MLFKSFTIMCLTYIMAALPVTGYCQEAPRPHDLQVKELLLLRAPLEAAKKSLVEISSELLVLRETAQFPERSQVAVFLTTDKLPRFQLESVELQLDGRVVSGHSYTTDEKEAMQKGGFYRLYTGNLDAGLHTLKAIFSGKLSDTQQYSGSVIYNFNKAEKAKVFTLGVSDFLQDNTPDMTIREDR